MEMILVGGSASGDVLDMVEDISFWGGIDPATGKVIEPGHPRFGETVSGRVVYMPRGRGSSSASSVLAELLRVGCGPAAIVLTESDPILAIGSLVANTLYGSICPVVVTAQRFADGENVNIEADHDGVQFRRRSADKQG
jgi:uncharacterized protein